MSAARPGHTCLNSFWKSARGKLFHAIVSVMAVKIQLSSPSGVLRSVWRPGMRSISSLDTPGTRTPRRCVRERGGRESVRGPWKCERGAVNV